MCSLPAFLMAFIVTVIISGSLMIGCGGSGDLRWHPTTVGNSNTGSGNNELGIRSAIIALVFRMEGILLLLHHMLLRGWFAIKLTALITCAANLAAAIIIPAPRARFAVPVPIAKIHISMPDGLRMDMFQQWIQLEMEYFINLCSFRHLNGASYLTRLHM